MRKIFQFLFILFLTFSLHMLWSSYFSWPLNAVHIIFVVSTLVLLVSESPQSILLVLCSFLVIEMYTNDSFGIHLLAAGIASIAMYDLYFSIVTNKTWYAAVVLCATGIGLYRVMYVVERKILDLLSVEVFTISWRIVGFYMAEVLISAFTVACIFFLMKKMLPRFEHQRV